MGAMERSIGVLDDDTVDGKVDVCGFADGKVGAKRRAGDFLNLGEGEVAG